MKNGSERKERAKLREELCRLPPKETIREGRNFDFNIPDTLEGFLHIALSYSSDQGFSSAVTSQEGRAMESFLGADTRQTQSRRDRRPLDKRKAERVWHNPNHNGISPPAVCRTEVVGSGGQKHKSGNFSFLLHLLSSVSPFSFAPSTPSAFIFSKMDGGTP